MPNVGSLIFLKKFHLGDGEPHTFPEDTQGVALLLGGVTKDQPAPDQLMIDGLMADCAVYRFELLMEAFGWDHATATVELEKVKTLLIDKYKKRFDLIQIPERPKLILVP